MLLLALAITIFAGCTTGKVEPLSPLDEFTAYLDQSVPVLMNRYDIPGLSIAIIEEAQCLCMGRGW